MEQVNNIQTMQGDTIDLKELFGTLKKRKNLILTVTLTTTLLALVYLFIAKPIYQVQAMIEVGKIEAGKNGGKPLDDIQDIKQKLEYVYGAKSKKKIELPRVRSISLDKKAKSIFGITVEGHSNNEATQYIENIIKKIEEDYAHNVNAYIDTQKELISLTQQDIKTNHKNIKELQKDLKNYNQKIMNIAVKDAALAGIYAIQISQNQTRLQSLERDISALKAREYNLQLSITPLKITRTHIVGEVEVLDAPIKPKKALILITAVITGLMFSVFLAFFLAFIESFREEENTH